MQEGKITDIINSAFMGIEKPIGIGIDICNVLRLKGDIEDETQYIFDYFTDPEIVYCEQAKSPLLRAQRYAARVAAKEAVIKALGGISEDGFSLKEINVLKGKSGRPFIYLEGRVRQRAEELGVSEIHISIAHEKDVAIAYCIAV